MHKNATKCNETLSKWCKNKHGASKIMDTLETYQSTGEPNKLSEALDDPKWRQAMEEEYNALLENKTWHLVPPSNNKNIIYCKWFYRIKKGQMVLLTDTKQD
jgi:hypothetical protein